MNEDMRKSVKAISVAILAIAALLYVYQYAENVKKTYPTRSFSVEGMGEIESTPDVAMFSVTVNSEGGTNVALVQQANTEKMNKINAFLKGQGIEEKDLKTTNYTLNPRYNYIPCSGGGVCPPPSISGYSIQQTLEVKVRDTAQIGTLLTGVVANGANGVSDIRFVVDDEDKTKNEARAEAIAKAKEKAEAMAKAGGFRIGELVSIYESSGPIPYGYGGMDAGAVKSESMQSSRIEPGTQETKVQVTLTYEIVN